MTDVYWKIGEMAQKTGLSVRTLRYYEDIGLLAPIRAENGYRAYGTAEVLRLQQILINRQLGLSLEETRRHLDDPHFDLEQALRHQRKALIQRRDEASQLVSRIDIVLQQLEEKGKKTMSAEEIIGGLDLGALEKEAQNKWGESAAWKQSQTRTAAYTESDWEEIRAEDKAIWQAGATAIADGHPPDSPEAAEVVARHRAHIERWFYAVSDEMHRALAEMWLADPRFQATIDTYCEGLTEWMYEAISAPGVRGK